ncbi:MAG: hypothetical protein F6K35_13435 [Okeania sp. SIO2H7]|nr:hypothetical protein [Okeania sp. SIO2H7]
MRATYKKSIAIAALLLLPLIGGTIFRSEGTIAQTPNDRLSPVHPDEAIADTLNNRFSLDNALESLSRVKGALSSFVQLTKSGKPASEEFEYTGWEYQNLGFPNWTGAIEGTLRKQEYQLKELELELARKQYEDGEISQESLQEKQNAYNLAKKEFQTFWNSFTIAD